MSNHEGDVGATTELNNILTQLAAGMVSLQKSVEALSVSVHDQKEKTVSHVGKVEDTKSYISNFKDLGGSNLSFNPQGRFHPMTFLKKLKRTLIDSGVPEPYKVSLAVPCLKGMAADWAGIKEQSFTSFSAFEQLFIARFWGVDRQRDLFLQLNYGHYEPGGSRSEYFLDLVNQASFLSEPIPEGKLIRMLSNHFASEIQRGIITRGLDTFETVDEYLRDIDETYAENVATAPRQARPPGGNGNGMRRQARERDVAREGRYLGHGFDGGRDGAGSQRVNRDQRPRSGETNDFRDNGHRNVRNENDNNWRRGEASDAQAADLRNRVRYITKFNEDVDALVSSDSDTENEDTEVFSPLIQINVLNHQVIALVDSGSEISAISEVFYNRISCDKQIPTIPTTNVSIGGAVGGKRQRVKVQVLLPIVVEKVKFPCDVQCLVIPNLNCDFLLGCDWLHGVQGEIHFGNSVIRFNDGEREYTVDFEPESKTNEVYEGISRNEELRANIVRVERQYRHKYASDEFRSIAETANADDNTKEQLCKLLQEYQGIFSECPGEIKSYMHDIEMVDETPFNCASYPIPFIYRDDVKAQISEMVEWGVVEKAKTDFISPLVVVKKKDGAARICLDARKLNSRMKKDFVNPPDPNDILYSFQKGQVFSTIDLTASYWQIKINPLLKLLRKNERWHWGHEEREAFAKIKEAFIANTVVAHPEMDRAFYISSDASHFAVAGCLFQLTDEGERRVIAYTSSTLRGSQLRYTVTEKEMLAVIHCLRQWRTLVLGRELVIYCDHKALSFALTCRLRSARLSRWILYLQEFDFTILHTPGKDNTVADVLSRFPAGRHGEVQPDKAKENEIRVMLTRVRTDYTGMRNIFRNMHEHQLGDEVIRAKLKFLEEIRGMVPILSERELSVCTWYIVHDGLLFKRGDTLNPGFKLCVPTSQVQNLVMSVHVNEGHFGKAKVYNFLKQYLYWPRMQRHIRQIIASCDLCQKTKCCATTQGPLHSVIPRRPGELVCTDLFGPLPVSRGGTTYILVFVDAFTKYVKIYALKRATTKVILKRLLKDYVPEVQKPTCILSDNGTQFTSGLWVRTLKEYGIRAKFLSVYFPAGNVTERYNKEIGRMLRAYCHQQHTNWATILPFVESCMNKSINESTGYSATLLQFGTLGTHPLEE
nr:unnamed protein product [Callosobruchus chinensis]